MGMCGQRHALVALSLGTIRYPLYRRFGGPQGRSGWVRKISPPPEFDLRTVQPYRAAIPTELFWQPRNSVPLNINVFCMNNKPRDPGPQCVGFPETIPHYAPKFGASGNFRPQVQNILHFSKP